MASAANYEPKIITDIISAEIDSNKSADCPAQSPTLSPTKSAITAGFLSNFNINFIYFFKNYNLNKQIVYRGSSSGIPTSIFPIRS